MNTKNFHLYDEFGNTPRRGDMIFTSKGEGYYLVGGTPPKHAGSTGRVWVSTTKGGSVVEFFPSVFGLEWSEGC